MTPEEYRDQHPEWQESKDAQQERCEKCRYYDPDYEGCCELESCGYERKAPELGEALKIAECVNVDYGNRDKDEIEELDLALDVIYAAAFRSARTAAWVPCKDMFKCLRCCHLEKDWIGRKYCSNCGTRMTGLQKETCSNCEHLNDDDICLKCTQYKLFREVKR